MSHTAQARGLSKSERKMYLRQRFLRLQTPQYVKALRSPGLQVEVKLSKQTVMRGQPASTWCETIGGSLVTDSGTTISGIGPPSPSSIARRFEGRGPAAHSSYASASC